MSIRNIDKVVFGADDLTEAYRFLVDWGLNKILAEPGHLLFETLNGAQVEVRQTNDPALPSPMQAGPTLREVVWGVKDADTLDGVMARLEATGPTQTGEDGLFRTVDPNGLSHGFRVSKVRPHTGTAQRSNAPGDHQRIDVRSPVYDRALPAEVGHIVLFAGDLDAMLAFYTDRLGFIVTDSYPGHAAFLRGQVNGVHHNAFILKREGKPGLNHVAFTVNDIHEVFGGGLAMSRKGWETDIGPGRHPISSAYFWYFKSPFGAALEYYADEDVCTEAWEPRAFERRPELFAEWAIAGGIDGETRRQARAATPPAH